MSEAQILESQVSSIPARDETGDKQIRWINERTGWPTNGVRCFFCGDFLRRNRQGGYSCFSCNPEEEKVKLIKKIRKKVRMVIRIE